MAKPQSSKLLTRAAAFAPSSFDAAKRSVQVVFSTGAPVRRSDFEGAYTERLAMGPDNVDLSQLRGAPVLDSHDRFQLRSILGAVENPTVDGERGVATLRFSDRPEVQGIVRDVENGIISRVSVGYSVQSWDLSKDSSGNRTKTATRWTPAEISFTAIAADPGAKTRAADDEDEECDCAEGEECECDEDENMKTKSATVPDQIRSLGTLLGMTDGSFVESLATRADVTIEAARSELLSHLQQQTPRIDARTSVTVTRDQDDDFADRIANVIAHRVLPGKIQLRADAQPLAHRRLADLGRECLRFAGGNTLGSDAQIIDRWLTRDGAMHSTSDFSGLLAQVFNKFLLPIFTLAPSGVKLITRRSTAADFRLKHVYRNTPMSPLLPLTEHGEIQSVTKGDVKGETYGVSTSGARFAITRTAMVNDDMSAFDDLGAQLARQSAEYENQKLVQLLVSNPVMSDGNPLFSTQHKNIAATPGAIAEATLSAARLSMRLQSNMNNQPIDVRPSYLLTTAANETAAQQALAAIYPTQTNFVNVFTDFVKLIIDPRLDVAGPPTAWYLFSDSTVPVLEDSYLSGYEGPRVTTRLSPQMGGDLDGVYVYLLLDYGCGAIGWQGGYYNAGQ